MKVLFIPLEFLRWQQARSMAYTAQLAVEEGLRHHGVEVVTLPAWGEVPSASAKSWLSRAKGLLAGQEFDQVWVTLVHSPFEEEFLSWLKTVAPVRIGLVMESLNYTEQECQLHPPFRERRAFVEGQVQALTHVLTVDERDAEQLGGTKLKALWWPSPVPARVLVSDAAVREASLPAEFRGAVYGERTGWVQHADLRGLLVCPPSPEDAAGLPVRFDLLQGEMARSLASGKELTGQALTHYVAAWRSLRRQIFDGWIAALRQGGPQVNLPGFVKAYAGRVVESMAAGCPVISFEIADRPRNRALFREGEEILWYRREEPAQLAAVIRRVQQEPEWARGIAQRALRKVAAYHTVEKRIEQVLRWVATGAEPDYGEASSTPAQAPAPTPVVNDDQYYVNLFVNSPNWSSPKPNADESARWTSIEPLVRDLARRQPGGVPLRILDVGCGRGWLTGLLSQYGQAEGVEPVAPVVEHARRLFPNLGFTAGNAQTILRRPDFVPYDLVVSSEVIEHVPEAEKEGFIASIARLLKPEGHVILTTPRGEVLRQWTELIGDPSQPVEDWMTEARLCGLLARQGFRVAGQGKVWFDIPRRAFTNREPVPSDGNFLAIYQVWAFQFPGLASAPAVVSPKADGVTASFNPGQPDYALTPVSPRRPRLDYEPAAVPAAPCVTIVTPFFNAGEVFRETVESVFRQSLQQWEWLIINDGSTDAAALRLLEEVGRKDGRIRVLNHPGNQGLSAARNTGFKHARAPYVFQLDADDLIEPTALEKMAWHLATHPEFAFTTGYTVGFGSKQYLWRNGFHCGRGFLEENLVTATCLVRKSVHEAIGGYDETNRGGLEDWEFWLKAAAKGHWGSTIAEVFDWYRRRETGREHWNNVVATDKTAEFKARLRQRYPSLWQKGFPEIRVGRPQMASSFLEPLPFANPLVKKGPRLLFLVPHFELGGADKFNLDLIRQLQRQHGYEVTVVATRRSANPWLHEFESLTPDVFVLNNFLLTSDFALFLRYLIGSRQPDVVCLSNSLLGYQLLPCLRAHFPDLPFVDYLHMEEENWMSGGYPRYSLHQRQQLTRTAVSSQHLKQWLVRRGGAAEAIDVCPTNIDAEKWHRARFDGAAIARKWNVDRTRPVILYAGRICDQKQPRVFAEVIRQVARAHPAFTVLVAGDGPDLAWLTDFVQQERLRQVRFLGAVSNAAVAELLAITDIFFLPSLWEGISLALYEALAMEAVPVAAAVGGQAELVTPDCGILVRRGSQEVADYTAALLKLLRSPEDRRRMAKAGRERVARHFSLDDLGRRMVATFNAARAVASTPGRNHVLPLDLAAIHAAEIVEQTRATDFADMLNREREGLIPFVKHSVEWRSCCRAGEALLQSRQKQAALEMFEAGLRSAAASRLPEIQLAAQIETARGLMPVDRARAEALLRESARLADQLGDGAARREIEQTLASLGSPTAVGPADAASRPPLVSVVIPCYRQAHFLAEAVDSVVAQTFRDWEIIIVNDGSPDDTSAVARRLGAKHSSQRIALVEQANGGLPAARNAGIRAARGRYILTLDADDQIRPTLLEKLVPILETRPKVGFAYSHIQHFGALDTEYGLPDFDRETLVGKDNIACVCALFRKSAWEQVGGYNEAMREGYEDWDFWIGCVEHGWEGYCLHQPLFLYRKHEQSMLADANQKRERLRARIVANHPKLYTEETRAWASRVLEQPAAVPASLTQPAAGSAQPASARYRITYLITSILGVTGGNQTLLRQAEEMQRRGHEVTIVTYTPKPDWFQFRVRVVQVPAGQPMAPCVPPSDVVVATYFTNAPELAAISAPVKVYYAQGDQFVFGDATMADTEQNRRLRELSAASYRLPGIRFVPNSRNLAQAVEGLCGRRADAVLPVCTDQTIFRPLQRTLPGSRIRLLIVGPDSRGSAVEPLLFKGIQDIHDALQILAQRYPHFTAVRMSATPPEIFARFPCEFYIAPADEMKTMLFGTSDILLYASHYDSCPRPPQEAMAAGCAVICTATPGALEYCRDGENALLVPPQSPAALADAVERLVKDQALRAKLVAGGLATAREFPREREWGEWEAMLHRFMAEAGKAGSPGSGATAVVKRPAGPVSIELPACALVGHVGQARSWLGQRQYRKAWQFTLAALQARPFHPEAYLLLAQIAQAAGDSGSARRCAQYARTLAPAWKAPQRFLKSKLHGNLKPEWLVLPDALAAQGSPAAPRLSVCLIVRNEERFLGQCLASVRGLADQLVVVDTGSTDRTKEIAREHGAEVYEYAWCDDFSAARNAALERATGDWVLMLDADEELPPENHAALRKLLSEPAVMAWRLPMVDVGREDEGCSYVPRLFRNAPALFYVGRVHEQIFTSVEVRRQEWGLDNRLGDAVLRHHGYRPEVVKDRNKIERNLRLLEKAIVELPDEPNLLMNYGLELTRAGKPEAGLEQYRRAFVCMSALPASQVVPETREVLLTQLSARLASARCFQQVVEVLTSPLAEAGGLSASLHFALGLAYLELRQPGEAAEQMRQCLAKRDAHSLTPINLDIRKAGPRHCLATCLEQLGQSESAAAEFLRAMQEDPQSRPVRLGYAGFLAKQGQPVEALQVLFELTRHHPEDPAAWLQGARLAGSSPDFLEVALDWTAEALLHLPQNRAIQRLRAEALLLADRATEALPLFQALAGAPDAALAALLILCETTTGKAPHSPTPQLVVQASREFLSWYQRLIQFNAAKTVQAINERLLELESRLPMAAQMLHQALAEAQATTAS